MTDIEIRPATSADAQAIANVGERTWPSTYAFAGVEYIDQGLKAWWSEEAVLRGLAVTRTFVAERDGAVVGIGNIDLRSECPIIWKLYVLPEHQGTGAGHALMAELLAQAPAGSDVLLEYAAGNSRAAHFYERHGFVELRRESPETDGWPETVWMVHRSQPR